MSRRARQKIETRERILAAAAKLFRKNGYASTGVDAVMSEAGLTAGGFYSHFRSKDDLLSECVKHALAEAWSKMQAGIEGEASAKTRLFIERYLSAQHRDKPEKGCPLVGIAAELGRASRATARPVADYLEKWVGLLSETGLTREQALRQLSAAMGALLLARLVRGEPLSDEILEAGKGSRVRINSKRA